MLTTTKIMTKKPCLKLLDNFFFFFSKELFLGKTISWLNSVCLKVCWRKSVYFIYQLSKCILRHSNETFSSTTLCIWFDTVHMKQFLHLKKIRFSFSSDAFSYQPDFSVLRAINLLRPSILLSSLLSLLIFFRSCEYWLPWIR